MCSVWVPFTSESKEALAHYPDIIKEIKLAVQEAGRRLQIYVAKKHRVQNQLERANLFERYMPEVADALSRLTGENKDILLDKYEPGKPYHKSDVIKQISEIKEKREKTMKLITQEQENYQNIIQKTINSKNLNSDIEKLKFTIDSLTLENVQLKEKNSYLEDKIKKIIENIKYQKPVVNHLL
jgi:DNA topoisomerase VI subunit B